MKADLTPEFSELRRKFRIFYDQELKVLFSSMEIKRKIYLWCFWILFILALISLPFFITFLMKNFILPNETPDTYDAYIVPVEIIEITAKFISLLIFIILGPVFFYKRKIKKNVMEKMISFFGEFSYAYKKKIDCKILDKSNLFSEVSSSEGDDYFQGKYKSVGITLSEEKHTQDKDKNKITTFRGIIILLDMDKAFQGKTIVKKDYGWLMNKFKRDKRYLGEEVELEDVVFEKYFDVFSDDQVEARFLLTTAFMERILKLKKLFKGKSIEFSFFDNKLLIKIPTKKDMFEPSSLFKPATDYNRIEQAFNQFCAVFAIIDILKLNRHTK